MHKLRHHDLLITPKWYGCIRPRLEVYMCRTKLKKQVGKIIRNLRQERGWSQLEEWKGVTPIFLRITQDTHI